MVDMTPMGEWWFWYAVLFSVPFVWIGPIGLFVLRKHLANAKGVALFVKTSLGLLTVVTAPLAAITALMVVVSAVRSVDVVWTFVNNVW